MMNKREELEKFLNNKRKDLKNLKKQIHKELDKKYTKDLTRITNRAIDAFYSAYKPKYYKRKYSLRYMYKIESKNGKVSMNFGGKYTTAKHGHGGKILDNEYIFNLSFIEGWHGGAKDIRPDKIERWGEHPETGIPYWRTPPMPWEDDNGEMQPPYTEWGIRAFNSKSPNEIIDEKLKEYKDKLSDIQNNIIDAEIERWFFK